MPPRFGINANAIFAELFKKHFDPINNAGGGRVVLMNQPGPAGGFINGITDEAHTMRLFLNAALQEFQSPTKPEFMNVNLETTLWVNAWDCWTIIGNGNTGDDSLDVFFGRYSAMSVLGWPKTNPAINYVSTDPAAAPATAAP